MQDLQAEQELARGAVEGSEASWKRIVDATCDHLFSLLCFQTGNREEARDLLQDTYVQAVRALRGYRGEAPLEAWLRTIALRKAIDWKRGVLRRLKRTVRLSDAAADTEAALRVEASTCRGSADPERAALCQALARLSQRQRAALLLREWEQRSFRQIAAILGCDESTARVHHTRARQRMRTLLRVEALPLGVRGEEGQ